MWAPQHSPGRRRCFLWGHGSWTDLHRPSWVRRAGNSTIVGALTRGYASSTTQTLIEADEKQRDDRVQFDVKFNANLSYDDSATGVYDNAMKGLMSMPFHRCPPTLVEQVPPGADTCVRMYTNGH